ncbi:MAG: HDIG domain-containing metalloprotein [Waddliaceae bacterium]
MESQSDLRFSREQGFFDQSRGIRLLIALAFILGLFTFLHFREVYVEVLELGSTAPRYVVAQVDTNFYDEEATILLRQEASRNIGTIYRLSGNEILNQIQTFEKQWKSSDTRLEEFQHSSISELYIISLDLEKTLPKVRLTDPRTLRIMKSDQFPTTTVEMFTPSDPSKSQKLPRHLWEKWLNEIENADTKLAVIDYFTNVEWNLEEDVHMLNNLKQLVESKVPEKYSHISAGSRIIDKDEKVTSRHIAMLQAMKEMMGERRNLTSFSTMLGSLLLSLLFTGICTAYFYSYDKSILYSNRKLFLIVTIVLITFGIAKITEYIFLHSQSNLIEVVRYPLFVPFSAILVASLMSPGIATFVSGFLAVILSIGLSFDRTGLLLLNLVAAVVAILSTRNLKQRKEIFIVCAKAWLACVVALLAMHLYYNTSGLLVDLISSASFMLLSGVLVVGLLPLLESGFGIMTDVILMEYMDPNHDLLRRLTIEAPGTYQHSVVVGNLAESAALSIGANGLFCRVATLYHDIGKMATPQYFTENQGQGGMNIHQLLTPHESAQVIIAHVSEGVSMARKAGLPEQFIDVIKEHHGTTTVFYFWNKYQTQMDPDKPHLEQSNFRYSGPKPRSKESAIIMIADSFEAAGRSQENMNEENLKELVDRLIRDKEEDGQFDNCLLTFEEMATIKDTLVKTLMAHQHTRVKYPKKS